MRTMIVIALVLASATGAWADPAAEMTEAHALIGAWLDAQNQHRFDAYAALYADDFSGVKKTTKGTETTLNAEQWKADRGKMFKSPNLSVETFAEQYAREPNGSISVAFNQIFRAGSYSDQGRKLMLLAKRNGSLKIVVEKLAWVGAVDAGTLVSAAATENVWSSFPKAFADGVQMAVSPCNKKGECDATLILGKEPQKKKVVVGKVSSDAEGEFTGSSVYRTRSFEYVPFAPLAGAVLVAVDQVDRDKQDDLETRIAAIVGKGPDHKMMWSGDASYSVGKTTKSCRVAVLPDEAPGAWDVIRNCGDKKTVARLK